MNRESELLKKWSVDASVPTNFNSVVWRRIEDRRRVSVADAIGLWMSELFAKRAVTVAYLSMAVVVGLTVAQVQSSKVLQERESQLQARYVQSVDPYGPRLTQ
jgi:hypothetical protein